MEKNIKAKSTHIEQESPYFIHSKDSNLYEVNIILGQLAFIISISFITIVPFLAFYLYGIYGLIANISIAYIAFGLIKQGLRNKDLFYPHKLLISFKYLIKIRFFWSFIFTMINLFLLLRFGLQTLISIKMLLLVYISVILILYIITKWIIVQSTSNRRFITYCLSPLLINIFFIINYTLSTNLPIETYNYVESYETVMSNERGIHKQGSSLILLENNKYSNFPQLRLFIDYEKVKNGSKITYNFKNGIFGFKVMTGYKII